MHSKPIDRQETVTCHSLSVDYRIPARTLIRSGRFQIIDPNILHARFDLLPDLSLPRHGNSHNIDFRLVPVVREMDAIEAIVYLETLGLRPCTAEELLSFAVASPTCSLQWPLVALGSRWNRQVLVVWCKNTQAYKVDLWPFRTYFRTGDLLGAVTS